MATPVSMVFDVLAIDRASAVFRKVGDEASLSGIKAESGMAKLGSAVGMVAKTAGLAAAAVGVLSVKMATDFQSSMLLIQTQAGATAQEVQKMTPAILSLAGQTAQAPEALATSMYHAYSVTHDMAQSLDVVRAAAKLATVSHSELEQTTNALTAAVASGIPGVQNMDQAIGMLNATVGAGDMKMSDLNQAMGSGLLTVVKGYGLSMRDVSAALATFGDNNIRGADAATMLRMAVQSMAVPVRGGDAILKALGVTTGQADQALAKYGITSKQLASDMQTGGLNKAVTDLRNHLDAAGIKGDQVGEILTTAFGKKAGPGVAVLLGQFDRLQQKYGAVDAATNTFGKEWEATTKTAAFSFTALKDSVDALLIRIGLKLLPIVTQWTQALTALVQFITGKMSTSLGGLGAQFAELWDWVRNKLVPAFTGAFMTALSGIQTAIRLVSDAVKSHRAELGQVWDVLKGLAKFILDYVYPAIAVTLKLGFTLAGAAVSALIRIVSALVVAWNSSWQLFKTIGHWFSNDFVSFFETAGKRIWNAFANLPSDIGKLFQNLKHYLMDPVAWVIKYVIDDGLIGAWDWVVSHLHLPGSWNAAPMNVPAVPPLAYATGGHVVGPGTGTSDSILARLSHGEFVVNAAATSTFRPLLEAINGGNHGRMSGGVPGFAGGGGVFGFLQDLVLPGVGAAKSTSTQLNAMLSDPVNAMTSLVSSLMKGLSSSAPMAGMLVDTLASLAKGAGQAVLGALGLGGGGTPGPAGSGVARWRSTVDAVLTMLGQPTSFDNGVLAMIQAESGGNPNAINLTDSNAAAGHPSQGLMQTIPSTFAAYAGPYLSRGITDGLANIYAGVNYALHRYGPGILASGGRHSASGQYVGYAAGTNYVPGDGFAYLHRGEAVIPAAKNQGAPYQSGGPVVVTIVDRDGTFIERMDGRIESALTHIADRGAYSA